jgi:hypothetical protein
MQTVMKQITDSDCDQLVYLLLTTKRELNWQNKVTTVGLPVKNLLHGVKSSKTCKI